MTDQSPDNRPWLDDRALAAAVYILYLIALGTALTALIGLVLAWQARPQVLNNVQMPSNQWTQHNVHTLSA